MRPRRSLMQLPPVPQIPNDLVRPQSGARSAVNSPDGLSKRSSGDSRTRFSDHLNDERSDCSRLEAGVMTPEEASPLRDVAGSSTSQTPHDDAQESASLANDNPAEIADSSQDVPSDAEDGSVDFSLNASSTQDSVRSDVPSSESAASAAMVGSNGSLDGESGAALGGVVDSTPQSSVNDVVQVVPAVSRQNSVSSTPVPQEGNDVRPVVSVLRDPVETRGGVVSNRGGERSEGGTPQGRGDERPASENTTLLKTAGVARVKGSNGPSGAMPQDSTSSDQTPRVRPDGTNDRVATSSHQEEGQRAKARSLSELLSRQGIAMESESGALDPAMSRVREVNQTVAHEQAIRSMNGRAPSGAPVSAINGVSGLTESGALETRTSVLSEVLSRSASEAKLVERATMVTARGMNALASQRGGSLTIRLDPPSLGQVMIRMSVSDGAVHAELHASNAAGRVVMERGLETLRASLESRGLSVERLSVQAASASSESQGARSESNTQGDGQHSAERDEKDEGRQDAAGRESRGRDQERGARSPLDEPNQNQQDMSFTQIMSEDAA
ncbi:MAG TPA: hypothetical protein DCX60_09620 [Phycisphaerales bacterium]|nr:hypothetical protein [Phycisphaerales bacterium]